jgi:hypothetical protein
MAGCSAKSFGFSTLIEACPMSGLRRIAARGFAPTAGRCVMRGDHVSAWPGSPTLQERIRSVFKAAVASS